MAIGCDLWPMSVITKPVGSKDRKLIIHPKEAVIRAGIRRNSAGKLSIADLKSIKIPDGIYIPENKEQGHRHIFCCDFDGIYHLYGRRLNVKGTYTDIWVEKDLWKVHAPGSSGFPTLPKGTALDLELCWPGHPDSEVTTAIKSHSKELHPYFFSILIWKGNSLLGDKSPSWINGRKALRRVVGKKYMTKGFQPIEINSSNKHSILEKLMNLSEELNIEGFVLKSMFVDGWWKVKGINEADVFVTGFKVSDSETRAGLVTGVTIGCVDDNFKIVDMGRVSGFNLEIIHSMTSAYRKYNNTDNNPFMYRTLRVIYQEIAGKGKLKHGFFDCWRDEEKTMRECSISQFKD